MRFRLFSFEYIFLDWVSRCFRILEWCFVDHLQEWRNQERHCDTAAAIWTLAGDDSADFIMKILCLQKSGAENDMPVLLINFYTWGRTWMWRGQSLEFRLSLNSCQIWTGRVYWRPLYVGLRRAQRCPHSPLKPICKSHLVHILWYDFGLKWAVYNSNCTFGLLEAYLKVLQLVSLNIG